MVGVLRSFDLPYELYADDVRGIAASTIGRFGVEEWKLVLLTNEIHGHLGIYSTIGAKMGLYARELLGYPISVLSYAGSQPPVSCLNDGLQIGCDATLGHGLIQVAGGNEPKARFQNGDNVITLRLKDSYARQVKEDIRQGIELYGQTPAYWQYVRTLALKYWSQWDRTHIFETEPVQR